MAYLYLSEQGAYLGISENKFEVRKQGVILDRIPIETIEIIEIFGNVQISTQCMTRCLRDGIDIIFFSLHGSYFGRLISTNHVNTSRQRNQSVCTKDAHFALTICKNIVAAKINNQMIIARRYNRNKSKVDLSQFNRNVNAAIKTVQRCTSVNQVIGHEGFAAKEYFRVLAELIDPDFKFTGRNKRPPKDPFNSLISFGYSLLINEIYGKIELKCLNPFWGFIHQDHEKHPTLASDLIEEWRAVVVDSLALSCINGHEIKKDSFEISQLNNGVYLNKDGFRFFVDKFEKKMNTKSKYLDYVDYSLSFRQAIDLQVGRLAKSIDTGKPDFYHPIRLR